MLSQRAFTQHHESFGSPAVLVVPTLHGMTSRGQRRNPFHPAQFAGTCPGCGNKIRPGVHTVAMEYQSRAYYHDRCWKKEIAKQEAEIQAMLDGDEQ